MAAFDLVLAWGDAGLVAPDQIALFAKEVRRVLRPGAAPPRSPEAETQAALRRAIAWRPTNARRASGSRPPRKRYVHPTRDLERALAGFSIQKTHLQRNQMREIVALKVIPRPG